MDELSQFFSQLTPQQLQALFEVGALDDQASDLSDQIRQAHAQQHAPIPKFSSPMGQLLGTAGDLFQTAGSAMRERDDRSKLEGVRNKRTAARKSYADLLRKPAVSNLDPEDPNASMRPQDPASAQSYRYGNTEY